MKDSTKKRLIIAGLVAVSVLLIFGISRVLYKEPVQELPKESKPTEEVELMVDTEYSFIIKLVPAWEKSVYEAWDLEEDYSEFIKEYEEPEGTKPLVDDTPKTGDTKDGMIYIEGFGWVVDNGGGGSGTVADDMYENGNKVGIMD